MLKAPFDPSPRSYARYVTPVRRAMRGPSAAPRATSFQQTADWLLREAAAIGDILELFEEFVWRINASGLPLHRASTHVGTLHPQLTGFAWNWEHADGFVDEVIVARESRLTDSFRRNPLGRVVDHGETIRVRVSDPAEAARFPLMQDLAAQGITDYLARPIGGGAARGVYNAATMATKREGGFPDAAYRDLMHIFDLFALHAERHIAEMISRNVLDTYLGASAGRQVLEGAIARGDGRRIEAIVWVSDLRDFSTLTNRLPAEDMTRLLNAYFEALAGSVMEAGGEVLKFIGDGMLAVFPIGEDGGRSAAETALAAAVTAANRLDGLGAGPTSDLPEAALPLRSGTALHLGEVFFGNVGAANRLDFTVIGKAVNEAARVEAMTKPLGANILVTGQAKALMQGDFRDRGLHELKGADRPLRLFEPVSAAWP